MYLPKISQNTFFFFGGEVTPVRRLVAEQNDVFCEIYILRIQNQIEHKIFCNVLHLKNVLQAAGK